MLCRFSETSTCKSNLQVQNEGGRTSKRTIKLYNLKMIIAIGLRAKSFVEALSKHKNITIYTFTNREEVNSYLKSFE